MDSLTHCVAGGLTPLLFKRAPKRTALVVFGILAGELPDIDFFFARGTPEGIMAIHRGLTHSVFFQPFLTLALVVPFFIYLSSRVLTAVSTQPFQPTLLASFGRSLSSCQALSSGKPVSSGHASSGHALFGQASSGQASLGQISSLLISRFDSPACSLGLLCVMAFLAQYVHIFLDCVTTFGTQLFLPVSSFRLALPGMFIIDFFLLVPIAVLWLAALRATPAQDAYWSKKTRILARFAVGWIIVYPLCNLGISAALTSAYANELGVSRTQVTVLTEPFTPFVWKKVIWKEDFCTVETVFPLRQNKGEPIIATYAVPDPALMDAFAKEIPLFAIYRDFAPTMVLAGKVTESANPHLQQTVYSFADVRYVTSPQSPARGLGRSSTSFAFEVKTSHGRVVAYRYLDTLGDEHIPWERL